MNIQEETRYEQENEAKVQITQSPSGKRRERKASWRRNERRPEQPMSESHYLKGGLGLKRKRKVTPEKKRPSRPQRR